MTKKRLKKAKWTKTTATQKTPAKKPVGRPPLKTLSKLAAKNKRIRAKKRAKADGAELHAQES